MDLGSLFLILALLVLVVLFISRPLLTHRAVVVSEREKELSVLLAERERILDALSELDFDHSMGKIPEEIYPAQRNRLLQRGAEVLRQLDALQPGEGQAPVLQADTTAPDDELEALIRARKQARGGVTAKYCPQCGSPVQAGDRFCASCGADLT